MLMSAARKLSPFLFSLLLCAYPAFASEQGEQIYQYDMGCAQIAVYERLPEVIGGIASGPAQHTLVVTSIQQGAILDNVSVNPNDAQNVTSSSLGASYSEGFIELARVPGGIRIVVLASDPSRPFSWRFSVKCHQGAVDVLHFEEIRSKPPHNDVQDKRIDKIFFTASPAPQTSTPPVVHASASRQPSTQPVTQPRNEIDSMLAELGKAPPQEATDAAANDPFAAELYAADHTRIRNEQLQQLASATERAEYSQSSALNESRQIAAQHLHEYQEAQRREAERRAAERERRLNEGSGAETFFAFLGGGLSYYAAQQSGMSNAFEYGAKQTMNALNGDAAQMYQDGQKEVDLARQQNHSGGNNPWEVAQYGDPHYQAERAAPTKQPYRHYQYKDKCGNGTFIDVDIPYRSDACLKVKIEFTKVHSCHYADQFAKVEAACKGACGNVLCAD